jgi:hypothetical protein
MENTYQAPTDAQEQVYLDQLITSTFPDYLCDLPEIVEEQDWSNSDPELEA